MLVLWPEWHTIIQFQFNLLFLSRGPKVSYWYAAAQRALLQHLQRSTVISVNPPRLDHWKWLSKVELTIISESWLTERNTGRRRSLQLLTKWYSSSNCQFQPKPRLVCAQCAWLGLQAPPPTPNQAQCAQCSWLGLQAPPPTPHQAQCAQCSLLGLQAPPTTPHQAQCAWLGLQAPNPTPRAELEIAVQSQLMLPEHWLRGASNRMLEASPKP